MAKHFRWLEGLSSPTEAKLKHRRDPPQPTAPKADPHREAPSTHRGTCPEGARVLHLRRTAQRQRPEAERHHAAAQDQLQQPERQQWARGQQRGARRCGAAGRERGWRGQHSGGGAAGPSWRLQSAPGPARPQRGQWRLLGGGGRDSRTPGLRSARQPGHRAAGTREHHGQRHGRAAGGWLSGAEGAAHRAPAPAPSRTDCARPNHLLPRPAPAAPTCPAGPAPRRSLSVTHSDKCTAASGSHGKGVRKRPTVHSLSPTVAPREAL